MPGNAVDVRILSFQVLDKLYDGGYLSQSVLLCGSLVLGRIPVWISAAVYDLYSNRGFVVIYCVICNPFVVHVTIDSTVPICVVVARYAMFLASAGVRRFSGLSSLHQCG